MDCAQYTSLQRRQLATSSMVLGSIQEVEKQPQDSSCGLRARSYHGRREEQPVENNYNYRRSSSAPMRKQESNAGYGYKPQSSRFRAPATNNYSSSAPLQSATNRNQQPTSPHLVSSHTPCDAQENCLIEISLGTCARLRGAQETWRCIEKDRYCSATCLACALPIFCISDAEFVLCPGCQVISPLDLCSQEGSGKDSDGVGLGFTIEDLQRWQSEILQRNSGGSFR